MRDILCIIHKGFVAACNNSYNSFLIGKFKNRVITITPKNSKYENNLIFILLF